MTWTAEAKDKVANLLREGLTAPQIGEEMGVSRNSIIGIVNRDPRLREIGFKRSPKKRPPERKTRQNKPQAPVKKKPEKPKRKLPNLNVISIAAQRRKNIRGGWASAARISPEKHPKAPLPAITGGPHVAGVTLMMLERHHCRWPVNDPEPGEAAHLFCGMRKQAGSSYCEHHMQASIGTGTPGERRAVRDAKKVAA